MNSNVLVSFAALLISTVSLPAQEKKPVDSAKALIEKLVDVKEPYLGSQYHWAGGGAFLPYAYATTCRTYKDPNDPFVALIKLGPKAVPALLEHLDDNRQTKSTKDQTGGFGWMSISCDDGEKHNVEEKLLNNGIRYTFRVGDFCYAALGQIVNRTYDLARAHPGNTSFLTSVPYTKQLVADMRKEWKDFTPEKHRELLVKDFDYDKTDDKSIYRARDASIRLAFYYPEVLETQASKQIQDGRYGLISSLNIERSTKLDAVVRDVLMKTDDDTLATACAKRLVGRGFDKDIEAYIQRRTPLAKAGDLEELKWKLGWTQLHVAVNADVPAFIERAMRDKTDVNARSKTGQTALHISADYSRTEALVMLLSMKADPNIADNNGRLPIEDFAFSNSEKHVRMLVAAGSKIPDIYTAVVLGDELRLKEFLKAKPDLVNARNRFGSPVLHMAAERGDTNILKVLLDHKAEIDAVGKQTNRGSSCNSSALFVAVENKKTEAAKLLLEHGANPNIPDGWKKTPLEVAARDGQVEIVLALLKHNADATIKDGFGNLILDQSSKDVRDAVTNWRTNKN